jgi:glycosyltransferase involved in cell wall biosynthesis
VIRLASKSPRVSIVVPNYNQGRYVCDAIQSALGQTYRSFEVIVVDDGSTDNSREVVAQFGDQVRYIWQENQGLAGARNTGIRAAKGDLIGLLDSDDQWLPVFLETMLSLSDQYPEATVYYCRARGMNNDGHDLPQVFGGPIISPEGIYQALVRANFLIPSTILTRRRAIMSAGLFDPTLRLCEDWDLWLRLLPKATFVGTSECMARYRVHNTSLSTDVTGNQQTVQAVIEKRFGPNDGQFLKWSSDKRRAYGGVFRYHLLTSVQRQKDWKAAALHLRRALEVDPTLATDLDLFYELALGSQPPGYRGTSHDLDIEENAQRVGGLLKAAFDLPREPNLLKFRRQVYGTAQCALALAAYNAGQRSISRRLLIKALRSRPDLWRNRLVVGDLAKSLLSQRAFDRIKMYWLKANPRNERFQNILENRS